jgi:predicted nucleic acid-binding protein
VIDASVGLKWVLPEPDSAAALALRDRLAGGGAAVYVPDLFWAETANVLWRLTRSGEPLLEPVEARELVEALRAAPLSTVAVGPVAGRALEIACETGVTVYDAAYVAVAELRGARLWTADRRLLRSLAGSRWGELASGVTT